jgi:chorismate dehydratase
MGNLVPLLGNKKLFTTADGSISFYNLAYEEAYHAKSVGAYTESLHKYVLASGIVDKLRNKDIKLLDIGFGIGYNLATTIEKTKESKHNLFITSIEKDHTIIEIVKKLIFLWPVYGYKVLRLLLQNGKYENYSMDLKICDARNFILNTEEQYDIIFFDPFSKKKNSELWDQKVIDKLYDILNNDGVITTYACSKKIRSDFLKSGFNFKEIKTLPDGFQNGTVFYK